MIAQEPEAAAGSISGGQIVDRFESFLLGNGRDFLRKVLESTLQTSAQVLEKRAGSGACTCGAAARHKGVRDAEDRAWRDRSLAIY
jgi:hypothetical protein